VLITYPSGEPFDYPQLTEAVAGLHGAIRV
jgi:hypothetical protein